MKKIKLISLLALSLFLPSLMAIPSVFAEGNTGQGSGTSNQTNPSGGGTVTTMSEDNATPTGSDGVGSDGAANTVDDICNLKNVSGAVKSAAGCNNTLPELSNVVTSILNGIIAVVGFVAVGFIVYAGIQYITSSGDSAKTTKARNTIFYSLIGLAVCALSFISVNFVLINIIQGAGAGTGTGGGNGGVNLVGDGNGKLTPVIVSIINGIIAVLGFVAVGFTVYGGVTYMSSGGDSAKVQKGRNIIIYSLIGLAICVLAFSIVNFVIVNVIQGQTAGSNGATTPSK